MTKARTPASTIPMVDEYCSTYRNLFANVRTYECFKYLHWGMIHGSSRKSLPAIASSLGLPNAQGLHQMLARTSWSVEALRNRRLALVHERLGARQQDLQSSPILLCVSEILTPKKGEATDYVSRQFDSNTAQYKRGILALLSCCIVGNETFPLRFRVFKPQGRLQDGELFASYYAQILMFVWHRA